MCIFAYLRHVGDGRNLEADLECAPNPQDSDHSKEPLVLRLQKQNKSFLRLKPIQAVLTICISFSRNISSVQGTFG